ncbi:MAG: hypothetical protein LLF76_07160 [Planctomycetaceae bacterium]|nr:hypothetical protein [Planctomycetaceae bacterium]
MEPLSAFEIELLRLLQQPLPLCARPFAEIAQKLNATEEAVLDSVGRLKSAGVIRRFRGHLDYRSLGFISSLVAAHVPDDKFRAVAAAVSTLEGVSHNYCRDHYYNLWFTLQAPSLIAIEVILSGLQEDFDIAFCNLPAVRLFKLNVCFDPAGPRAPAKSASLPRDVPVPEVPPAPMELTEKEKKVLSLIQDALIICKCPFEFLDVPDLLAVLQSLHQRGAVRKIAAVLDYQKLGYVANALFCIEVPAQEISRAGADLAAFDAVSHCYQRKTCPNWPFNLYAMCHAADVATIESLARSFCTAYHLSNFQILPTVSELKKEPVRLVF